MSINDQSNSEPAYLSPDQASAFLQQKGINVAKATLAKMRVNGSGPHFRKLGKRVLYAPRELSSWLDNQVSELRPSTSVE